MILKKKITAKLIIDITVVVSFLTLVTYISIRYYPIITSIFIQPPQTSLERLYELREIINSYGSMGAVISLFVHSVQVIIAIIPGNIVQFASGLIYGVFGGLVISQVGIAIGTATAFYLTRVFGKSVLELFFTEKAIKKFTSLLERSSGELIYLTLFMIPGFPKDFIAYYAGLTRIKAHKFLALSALGRTPGIFMSCYMGATLFEGEYKKLATIMIIAAIPMLVLFAVKDKIKFWA